MPARTIVMAGVVSLALFTAGCGGGSGSANRGQARSVNPNGPEVSPAGDIPDNQAYVAYAPPGAGYSVKVPEGWARTSSHGATTFTDKLNSIRMETVPAAAALTVRDARRTELPKLAAAHRHFRAGTVTTVARAAGPAVRITFLTDSRADPVTGKVARNAVERYVFFHRDRDVVLTLTGPKGADNVDPWRTVTDSLRFTR